jgi:integrase
MIPKTCFPIDEVQLRSSDQEFEARIITPEQARAIFEQLRAPENILLLLTAVTGLRCGEVLGVKWEDSVLLACMSFVTPLDQLDFLGPGRQDCPRYAPSFQLTNHFGYLHPRRRQAPFGSARIDDGSRHETCPGNGAKTNVRG